MGNGIGFFPFLHKSYEKLKLITDNDSFIIIIIIVWRHSILPGPGGEKFL